MSKSIEDIAVELAEKIFSANTDKASIPLLIEHTIKGVDDPKWLLVELPRALMELKKYETYLVDAGETEIRSNFTGNLLYENYNDPHLDVIAIIGPLKLNENNVLNDLRNITDGLTRSDRIAKELLYRDAKLKRGKMEIIYRHQFPNLGRYAEFESIHRKGDLISHGNIVGKLKFKNYSSKAITYYEKFMIADAHCKHSIENLTDNIATPLTHKSRTSRIDLEETFESIWQGDISVFNLLMRRLEKKTKDGGPFIERKETKIYWLMQPSNGWQKYLIAFLYFCVRKGYIVLNGKLSSARLNRICQNHFNITPIDPDNLSLLRSCTAVIHGNQTIDTAYNYPFVEMFKDLN